MTTKQTALITGCSNGGIGHALALKLHSEGVRVFATSRTVESMAKLKAVGIEVFELDVTKTDSINTVKSEIEKLTGGTLDMLVNNAGVTYESTAVEDSIPRIRSMFDVNVFGMMEICQHFIPLLVASSKEYIAQGNGRAGEWGPRIVMIGSVAAMMPAPFYSSYNASKAAMTHYGSSLRVELSPFGIQVIDVHVGRVLSRIIRDDDWQGLPEGSIFMPIKDIYEGKAHDAHIHLGVTCEAFAKEVIGSILKKDAPSFVWTCTGKWFWWLIHSFFPRTTWDFFLWRAFALGRLASAFQQEAKANQSK